MARGDVLLVPSFGITLLGRPRIDCFHCQMADSSAMDNRKNWLSNLTGTDASPKVTMGLVHHQNARTLEAYFYDLFWTSPGSFSEVHLTAQR
jgi:hypothetical protein